MRRQSEPRLRRRKQWTVVRRRRRRRRRRHRRCGRCARVGRVRARRELAPSHALSRPRSCPCGWAGCRPGCRMLRMLRALRMRRALRTLQTLRSLTLGLEEGLEEGD